MKNATLFLLVAAIAIAAFMLSPDPYETRLSANLERAFGPGYRVTEKSGRMLVVESNGRFYAIETAKDRTIVGRMKMTEGERSPLDPSKRINQ